MRNQFFREDLTGKHGVLLVLVLSGFFGLVLGLAYSTWHVVAETAQVVSGIVKYPRDNPFYIYHVKVWTILNQIGALALYYGLTEKTLSIVLSGLMGMFSFQALSLFVFSLCGNIPISIFLPFFMQFTQVMDFGINYPVQIINFPYTYGVVGLSMAVLTIALFNLKCHRAGGLFLGLLPAVHPMMSVFLGLSLLIILFWDYKRMREPFFQSLGCFMAGCAVSGASLAAHMLITYDVPKMDPATEAKYIGVIVRFWDAHRMPVNFLSVNFYLCILSAITSFAVLRFGRRDVPENFFLPMRILVITGVIGGFACVMSHVPPEMIPPRVMRIMPTRILGINSIVLMPLLVGMYAYYKDDVVHQLNLFALMVVLTLILTLHPVYWGRILMLVITLSAAISVLRMANGSSLAGFKPSRLMLGTVIVLLLTVTAEAVKAGSSWESNRNDMRDWRSDPMFAKIHAGNGVLLVGPHIIGFMQLYVARPVYPGLMFVGLPYVPEAGPPMDAPLKEIFGVDLFNPPEESRRERDLPIGDVRVLWEARTLEEWQKIKARYNLTDIFTYGDWKLQLPVAHPPEWKVLSGGRSGNFMLYHVP